MAKKPRNSNNDAELLDILDRSKECYSKKSRDCLLKEHVIRKKNQSVKI